MTGSGAPLVSIGLPTYNRETLLRRAVESLLAQDYPAVELLISDNASPDGTEAYCRDLAAREPRVKYFRQPRNVGATANYVDVQRRATGAYYMNMADDDAPAPNYLRECVAALEADPTLVIALGVPLMSEGDVVVKEGARTNLLDASGADRVCAYYRTVEENVAFLGVMRTRVVRATPPSPNTMGNDWLYMAAVAFQGKIRTVESTSIRKQVGGASRSTRQIAKSLGLPRIQGVLPMESIMLSAFRDVAWRHPVFAPLGAVGRWRLAARVVGTLSMRFHFRRAKKGLKRRLSLLHPTAR
jgi:glycosyltransferase involved in cell wall biosynthesis